MAADLIGALRRNWLATILLTAGLVLRVLTQLAYRPVLFYIDSIRYLYTAQGNDPVGYRVPLRVILSIGNLDALAVIQHLLGLGMAVTIYVVLVRRSVPRWLAALAIAPVLLDAYQLQIEQLIMPDIWFEALIVAGIAALLIRPRASTVAPACPSPPAARVTSPGIRAVVAAGLLLGISATFRQVGEILIVPALLYVIAAKGGWRRVLIRSAALAAAFVLPILAYSTASYLATGHFWLSHSGVTTTYGRMAAAADCGTLRLPAIERALCPTPAQRALGPDGLEHSPLSPRVPYYVGPLGAQASHLLANFNHEVLVQQPLRVLGSFARDAVKLFALTRATSPGDAPIPRWQFQTSYPYFPPHASRHFVLATGARYGGGKPMVWTPVAEFLRGYQLDGGYTPGPLLAFCVLAGLAGSVLAGPGRRRLGDASAERQQLALACLLFFCCGAALLLMSDLFEFSWRYQLPALVTLPPAGALAVAAFCRAAADRRAPGNAALAEAGEQVSLRD